MFRGPATINMYADDMDAAVAWYTSLFGGAPYFRRPVEGPVAYAEWRIGDRQTEVGLISADWAPYPTGSPSGAVVHWAVDDLGAALDRVLSLGATELAPVTERGEGFVTASVVDPFGNVLGLMTNPHYAQVLAERG
jgi:predicted enzyme related to lactoylglutathione lyase